MKLRTQPRAALAFLWLCSAWGADSNILTLIDYPAATATQAWGINTRGDIVGFYTGADKTNHGFLLNGGKFTSIDYPGAAATFANGVNPQGDIVAQFRETTTSPYRGLRLGADGVFSPYDFPGAASTFLEGINSSGDIVGGYTLADGITRTFLLSGQQLTKIEYPGATSTGPLGISPQAEVIGLYSLNGVSHGYVWSSGGGFTTIDYPKATYTNSTGRNSSGDTVGRYLDSASVSHGYLLSNGQFTSFDCPGATFTGATAIDPAGNIVGRCQVNGVFHGFLLKTAKPATRYAVTDLGPVGPSPGQPFTLANNRLVAGVVVNNSGYAQATVWSPGGVVNLAAAKLNSYALGINESGFTVGQAEIDSPDPAGEDFCADAASGLPPTGMKCVAFAAQNGIMRTLRTLGGSNGIAIAVNSRGAIAGGAETAVVDPGCPAPQKYQFKPVIWQGNEIEELPLVGTDKNGAAQAINDLGHAVGGSGACGEFSPSNGLLLVSLHALLWETGRVVDLGNLGGKGILNGHFAHIINNLDEVVGSSDLKGDMATHAFRWTKIGGLEDLGTLGGDVISIGLGLNDAGTVTGISANADFSEFRAFVWTGGVMTDLNSLIPAKSSLYLLTACSINARGEMIGFAADANGDLHAYLASPLTVGEEYFATGARRVALSANSRQAMSRLVRMKPRK